MAPTSSPGNKIILPMTGILAITLCALVGAYRVKKTSEIKLWEKQLAVYSYQLESENQAVKNQLAREAE